MKPGLRDRKREATKSLIWQSAMRLFAEHGYDEVTIEDIASVCDLSPRTFFRYYATKEEVLFAGTEMRRDMFLEALEEQPADLLPFDAIYGASRKMATHYLPEFEALQTRDRIVRAAPSLRSTDASFPGKWDTDVMEILRRSGRADDFSDLELRLVTGAAMTALRVTIQEWIASGQDLFELLDASFGLLAVGLVGPPRRGRRRKAAG